MFVTNWFGQELVFLTVPVAVLPLPDLPIENPDCMVPPITVSTRIARQLRPRRVARECCDYHGADWHAASRAAIGVIRRVSGTGLAGEELEERIEELLTRLELPEVEREAAESLVHPDLGIRLCWLRQRRIVYQDGRHRARALQDAGVRRTVVAFSDWDPPW